nr:PREDICTED: IQ domain-containing protein K isoform X2 [Latimeria chalumnae]|eukprot:XP_005999699.1 PREDICTED: IQ domain-containing protein K isoform X2 [Latimeria chalumnae]
MAKVIGETTKKNLWEQICEEFEAARPRDPAEPGSDKESVATQISQYSASKHSPVFYGQMVVKVPVDTSLSEDFNPEVSHPALVGYALVQRPPPPPVLEPPPPPDPQTCSPQEYLEHHIFPVLLPGMAEMLQQAKKEKCFERKRTKFIACDYLTEWLYNKNVKREGEPFTEFFEIPFVMEWLKDHPRPPIPLSLLISEEEAALLIQAFWRAYRVRCDPEIQELRVWQKQLRDEKRGMKKKLLEFWAKQQAKVGCKMEDVEEDSAPNRSGVAIRVLSPTPQNTLIL